MHSEIEGLSPAPCYTAVEMADTTKQSIVAFRLERDFSGHYLGKLNGYKSYSPPTILCLHQVISYIKR